jgi:beta-glucanase (GH16 family)
MKNKTKVYIPGTLKLFGAIFPLALLIVLSFAFVISGCKKDDDEDFTADFNIEYVDDNHVRFSNNSSGEYYSMIWNFGNGEGDTTTNKKQSYYIYYPQAGNYQVSLRLTNYSGSSKSASQTVNILVNDLVVDFSADAMPAEPNHIVLRNTSLGDYDSFKWRFRNREVEDEMEYIAWFPFAGTHDIELEVMKNGNPYSLVKSISISQNDPDYVEKLELIWSEEFEGSSVNTNDWTFETGSHGWGNNELQNYTDGDNAEVIEGKLIITARKVNDNYEPGSYTSSRMTTRSKHSFQYGRMEIRAKLPSGTGIWPAIWMLGSNYTSIGWPDCGEIDIMEYVGYQPNTVHATIHNLSGYGSNGNGSSYELITCEEEFHNYGIIWTEYKISFYVDSTDNIIHTYAPPVKNEENWPFDQPAFFILNVAVGGDWGGAQGIDNSIFPQSMEIDYVRVYQEVTK